MINAIAKTAQALDDRPDTYKIWTRKEHWAERLYVKNSVKNRNKIRQKAIEIKWMAML